MTCLSGGGAGWKHRFAKIIFDIKGSEGRGRRVALLDGEQYLSWCQRLGFGLQTKQLIDQIRCSPPARVSGATSAPPNELLRAVV
jgi:hypothetical protein